MQRLGEELKRLKGQNNVKRPSNLEKPIPTRNEVFVITSDAIDFASVHGMGGRIVPQNHPNYASFHNLKLKRYQTQQMSFGSNKPSLVKEPDFQDLESLCKQYLALEYEDISSIISNGPILPQLNTFLHSPDIRVEGFCPEIVHCTYLPYATLLYTLLIGKKLAIPTVVTPFLHDANSRYDLTHIIHVLREFSAIVACTEYEKQVYVQNGIAEKKVAVIPMGVDHQKFAIPTSMKKKRSIISPASTVLFCGNKNYEKGAITLLNAIPHILMQVPNAQFCFIGSPTKAYNYTLDQIKKTTPNAKITNLTPENLTGVFDGQKIQAFQEAALYCMPSRSEAYGIAYLEAWACKKPVIAADFPPMREVVAENDDGLIVRFDDVADLTEKVIYLLKNSDICCKMGEKGYNKILHNNTWRQIAQKTIEMYKLCLRGVDLTNADS